EPHPGRTPPPGVRSSARRRRRARAPAACRTLDIATASPIPPSSFWPPPCPPPRAGEGNKKAPAERGRLVRDHVIFQTFVWRTFHLAGNPVGWQASQGRPLCHS